MFSNVLTFKELFFTNTFAILIVRSLGIYFMIYGNKHLSLIYQITYILTSILALSFAYFYMRVLKQKFYDDFISQEKSQWLTDIFENIDSGIISIKKNKIMFINEYFKNVLLQLASSNSSISKYLLKFIEKEEITSENFENVKLSNTIDYEDPNSILLILLGSLQLKHIEYDLISQILLELKNEISQKATQPHDILKIFIKHISTISDIKNFSYLGEVSYTFNDTNLNYEINCMFKNRNEDYDLTIVIKNVTKIKTRIQQKTEFKFKNLFLAKVAHEFKNPLICISELVNQTIDSVNELKGDTFEMNEKFNQIKSLSDYLLILIRDLEFFNEVEGVIKNRQLQNKPTDVKEITKFCKSIAEALIIKSNKFSSLKFKTIIQENIPNQIVIDEWRLKQVLVNLLSNAIKFTNFGEVIFEVKNEIINHTTYLKFLIKDTGVGIREEIKKQILRSIKEKVFIKGDAGLGLNISYDIAYRLNCEINFTSANGKGSSFWINVPIGTNRFDSNQDIVLVPTIKKSSKNLRRSNFEIRVLRRVSSLKNYKEDNSIISKDTIKLGEFDFAKPNDEFYKFKKLESCPIKFEFDSEAEVIIKSEDISLTEKKFLKSVWNIF